MRTISRGDLEHLITSDPTLIIVEALPEPFYHKAHLPGAINIPHTDIATLAPQLILDRDATVVTYCINLTCENSGMAARSLDNLGYTNVLDYADGKQDWVAAGLSVENGRHQESVAQAPDPAPLTMVSCSLDEDDLAARSELYRRTLFAGALERREHPDGYAFRFPSDGGWRAKIEAFVNAEQRCCSFFQIDVSYGAGLGPIWLTLTGPDGTKIFIENTFDVELHV